ncbi:AAA family ATPase [Falsarthrobacter nasiphocae]|uniref:DNA helicase IV n=1 Tax=Falsarthrobacter nasiphocae TaxID=189863 RepID=A0AAE3YID0_9MICC|nr:AAA family ATPase [Falsarthrobacter nasiphocae]MDR6892714.1 DNA helicase IV [Falsarthrobacter nasiphocae]
MSQHDDEIRRAEQGRVDRLYARLDELRAEKEAQLAEVRRQGPSGTFQNISERDSFAALYEDRLAQLYAVEDRLVFGTLTPDGAPGDGSQDRSIGRIGLTDEHSERLLIDWRAPEAGTFYQATAFDPRGIARRRHLFLRGRALVGIEDEILSEAYDGPAVGSGGDAALLRGVTAKRTGRMNDIVATIQKEQDAIIRRPLPGITLVQGGPGTGKTAVALHRAAYLLYTYRERLGRSGVLLVGPSTAFIDYIERVLPSLGETGVVMRTVGELYPSVAATAEDAPLAAEVKGRLVWRRILERAVRQRQRNFAGPRPVNVEGFRTTITPKMVRAAQERARATRQPYNKAREVFVQALMDMVTERVKEQIAESGQGNTADRSYVADDVAASHDVRVAVNLAWMPMTPERLLRELWTRPEQLVAAAPELSSSEIASLVRKPADGAEAWEWTVSDVPLLDELADLLGPLEGQDARRLAEAEAQDARDTVNAEKALENVQTMLENAGIDGVVTAEDVKASLRGRAAKVDAATAADLDREWAYGHVVVDEAQELTQMQWHTVFKRVPIKSLTVVGDIAQASSPGAARSWREALEPFASDRFEELRLTINYRTPRPISDAAVETARALGAELDAPQAIREGEPPRLITVEGSAWRDGLRAAVAEEILAVDEGLVAAVVPSRAVPLAREALASTPDVRVLDADEAKGLEFDSVVLMDPEAILADAGGRSGSLYVAMTRPTHRLTILAVDSLPAEMAAIIKEGRAGTSGPDSHERDLTT